MLLNIVIWCLGFFVCYFLVFVFPVPMLLLLLFAVPCMVKAVLINTKTGKNVRRNSKKATQFSLKCFGKSVVGTRMSPPAICINCFNSFPSCSRSCISKERILISSYFLEGQPAQTSSIPMT